VHCTVHHVGADTAPTEAAPKTHLAECNEVVAGDGVVLAAVHHDHLPPPGRRADLDLAALQHSKRINLEDWLLHALHEYNG